MSAVGQKVVLAARGWIGTPYRHQASCRGAGTDCLGLVRGVWRDVIGPEPAEIPPYTQDWAEPQGDELLWQAALRYFRPKPSGAVWEAGDLLLFRMRDGAIAKHLGVLSQAAPEARFIHAYSGHGVVESPLSAPWRRRIAARFVFPGED